MAEIKLNATQRTEFGKGAARRTRRAGLVPAVLYGHGTDPMHLTLPGHETLLALRQANALLELTFDDGSKKLALPKQIQRDPIKGFLDHVDLLIVKRGEKVTVDVPVTLVGELSESDLVANQEETTLPLLVLATNIPEGIEVNISELAMGDKITAADLTLPEGSELATSEAAEDVTIVSVVAAAEEPVEDEGAEGEEGAEAADEASEDAE